MFSYRNTFSSNFLEIIRNIKNWIKITFIVIIHFTIKLLILKPIDYVNDILWYNGICRKCKSGRYISDFRADRFVNNQFYCSNCKKRFYSSKVRFTVSDTEYKNLIRDIKIKNLIR